MTVFNARYSKGRKISFALSVVRDIGRSYFMTFTSTTDETAPTMIFITTGEANTSIIGH